MQWTLKHDVTTGELRVVATDFYQGTHERREWQVVDNGRIVRNRPELAGLELRNDSFLGFYYTDNAGQRHYLPKSDSASLVYEKTPCPKATSARRKCGLC